MMKPFHITRALLKVAPVALILIAAGCPDAEIIIVDREPDRRDVGEGCVLNDDCDTGRCIGGICDDGSCDSDDECLDDEVCVFGACEPADQFACTTDQQPLISVTPLEVEFGEVALGNQGEAVVTIENLGDCLLTLESMGFAPNADPGFDCDLCDPAQMPQRIPPQRTMDVTVSFDPPGPGEAESVLVINSDDNTAGEDGIVEVNLHAAYSGVPVLIVEPLELNFGFVAAGSTRTETFRITNQGSGNAALTIDAIFVQPPDGFTIPEEFVAVNPVDALTLPPYNPNDPTTYVDVPVTFAPEGTPRNYSAQLKVRGHAGDVAGAVTIGAQMSGSSLGPPQINVNPIELTFEEDDGSGIAVGNVTFQQVTISNSGQSDLSVDMSLFDPTGDFSVSPPFIAPIAAGGAVTISIFYNPSEPSDPVNPHDPQTYVNASLNITSNDDDPAEDVLKQVSLRGLARGGVFDDVLKVEMTFQNADNSWAGNDFRDVDLEVQSPTGFSCTKPVHQYAPDGNGGFIVTGTEDLCDDWNAFGQEGVVNWIALGQYEEPERVLLHSLGQDLAEGGLFVARAHFIEDCANIPTGILGDILGIGGSILLGALGGAIGVPIAVDPGQISDLVTENCWDRESSLATLHVFLNGEEVASPQFRLRDKGDCAEMIRLRRVNGQFLIESADPAPCN
jgi:hypothetical protein